MKPFLLHYTPPHSVTCLSASHLSGFSRGGWKSLLSLGLHSLLNSLSLYLWQGQKQQKQPEKDCNLQETQCSASLGLMEFHGKHLPVTVCMSGKNAWEHWNILRFVTNLKNHTKKITPKKHTKKITPNQSHCLVFAVHLPWQGFSDAEPPLLSPYI